MRKATTPLPTADLTETTWGIPHIAVFMRVRLSAANSLARREDFPQPLAGNIRYWAWLASDVIAYLTKPRPRRSGKRRRPDPAAAPVVRRSVRAPR